MGFPHLFLSHLSQPLWDWAQFEIAAADHYLFPFPGEKVKKEPKLRQFSFQSDPRLRNSLYVTLFPNGYMDFFLITIIFSLAHHVGIILLKEA